LQEKEDEVPSSTSSATIASAESMMANNSSRSIRMWAGRAVDMRSGRIIMESLSSINDVSDMEGEAEGECEERLDLLNADLVMIMFYDNEHC
jgi:hypothetical protein